MERRGGVEQDMPDQASRSVARPDSCLLVNGQVLIVQSRWSAKRISERQWNEWSRDGGSQGDTRGVGPSSGRLVERLSLNPGPRAT